MNILVCLDCLGRGGLERQALELARALKDNYKKVYILAVYGGDYKEDFECLSDQLTVVGSYGKNPFKVIFIIDRLVSENRIHIIYSFSATLLLLSAYAKWKNKAKLINGSIRHSGVTKGLNYLIDRYACIFGDYCIANSMAGINYLKLARKYSVIYNFIRLERFGESGRNLRNVVMTANMHHMKDHPTFFRAMRLLHNDHLIDKVGLIGDGPNRRSYELLADEYGLSKVVTFYGKADRVEEIIRDYGIGVLCSTRKYSEGVSNAILEYMATGLIAVGSSSGGTKEIIIDNETGFLFDEEDEFSLVDRIKFIQNNSSKMESVRAKARKMLEMNHNTTINTQKIIHIIDAL